MPFGPPLNPAKKCGSIKPVDDAHVRLDEMAVDQRRRAVARRPELPPAPRDFPARGSARDNRARPPAINSFSSSARVLGRCVPSELSSVMFSRGNMRQMLQQPRDEPVIRRRAGDVREADATGRVGRIHSLQRPRADGLFQRGDHRRPLVRQPRRVRRLDDRRPFVRQLNRQMSLAVGKLEFHAKLVYPKNLFRERTKLQKTRGKI